MTSTDAGISTANNSPPHPGRRVQAIEVAVFLFLILPSTASSFFMAGQVDVPFVGMAVSVIATDLALVCLILYFMWRNGEPNRRVGWTMHRWPGEVALGVLLFFPVVLGANLLEGLLHSAGLSEPTKLPSFLVATGATRVVLAVLMVTVVALAEETIFRGYLILRLQAATGRTGAAVVLSTLVFCVGHGYEGAAGVISVFFLGLAFALIYVWRKSLVAPMIMHFLTDFTSIVLASVLTTTS